MANENKAVILRLFGECFNDHNIALVSELYSGVVYRAPGVGELRGDSHRQMLISLFAGFPDAHWTVEDQIAEDDRVVTRWSFLGTHQGEFAGIAATGRQVTITGVTIDRLVGGKIVEEWEEWDTLGVMRQLGVVPA